MAAPIRVLLVEDNEADAYLTREMLESSKLHIEMSHALDGVEALELLERTAREAPHEIPDLLLLDLNLPRMDGREVLSALKAHPQLRKVPVVMLTSSSAEMDIAQTYELGANCYVAKPVGLESFQSIVRAVESFWFTVVKLPVHPRTAL